MTGWSSGLSQDYDGKLGTWFADRLGARNQLRRDMETTDRELLELAAKAAGYELMQFEADDDVFSEAFRTSSGYWNPLTDDGDALRLAVYLRITPNIDNSMTDCEDCTESHLGDPYAATRRAIVRAAAEIGGGMQ